MNRTLGIERVYALGEYKTLRVSDQIVDIPEELALNDDFIDAVRRLQLVSLDLVHQKYYAMTANLGKLPDGAERQSALIEIRANVMDELNQIIKNVYNKE